MTFRTGLVLAAFAAFALATAACGGSTPTAPTLASPSATDTFTGTLGQNGGNTYTFSIKAAGEVDATLVSVTPLSTLALGFVLGTYDGTNCNPGYENDNARQGQVLTGVANAAATNACVRVFDVGNITQGAAVSYTVTVAHP